MTDDLIQTEAPSEITVHVAAYHKFTLLVKWVMVLAASMLAFLGLWIAAHAGFIAGLIAGLIVLGAGTYALRHGWAHSSEDGSIASPQAR